MKSEPYTGTVAGMKTSPWLASEDLAGLASPELTIEAVYRNTDVKMDGGRTEPELFSLKFKGAAKQMILNATNRRELTRAFGADTKNWTGKRVQVYVQDGVKFGGKVVSGLRLRACVTAPFTPPKPEPEPLALSSEPETSLERLRRKVAEDGLSTDKLNAWLERESLPTYDLLMENEAEAVLALYTQLKKEAA